MNKIFAVVFVLILAVSIIPAQTKVACVGNSITAGNGSDTGYTARLQKLLGSTYQVQNDGKSGCTLLKHGDVPYWTHDKFPQVFTLKPDIITIKLGTNDTKPQNWDKYNGEFKKDFLSLIDTFTNALTKKPKIYLVLPVPSWTNTYGIRDSAMKKILVIIKQIALERSLPLIDCYTPLVNFKSYFPDGVHPDDPGADTIAHTIYRALTGKSLVAVSQHASLHTSIAIREKQGKLFVNIPFSGRTVVETFNLCGKRLSSQTFEQSGNFILRDLKMHGVLVAQIENQSLGYFHAQSIDIK